MRKVLCSVALLTVMVVGMVALTTGSEARPRPPGPLCGWTTLWDCTLRNGNVVQIVGTQCDAAAFEKKRKATCVPATF